MAEDPNEAAVVAFDHPVEEALGGAVEGVLGVPGLALEEERGHDGAQAQRDEGRDDHRHGHRDGEFAEEAADDAAHQKERNEDRDEGKGDRYDGEPDLTRTLERRIERALPHLDVAEDVLEHDDGVVDDEADRDGERHEREVVDAVAEQVHGAERRDERERHGDARNDGRPGAAQEDEDHHHHETHGDHEGELHVADRGTDRQGAVGDEVDLDRGRDRGLETRYHGLDLIDDGDRVGTRLALDKEEFGPPVVEPSAGAGKDARNR